MMTAAIACGLAVADMLSDEHLRALYAPMAGVIPWHRLYESYGPEDFAVEDFCEQLSAMEGGEARLLSLARPAGGSRVSCDAAVRRRGRDYALAHAPVRRRPGHAERRFDAFVKSLGVEEEVEARFPDYLVHIHLPPDAFEVTEFDEQEFKQRLVEAVARAPIGGRPGEKHRVELGGNFAPARVSRRRGAGCCFVLREPASNHPLISSDLEEAMSHAIRSKSECLKNAKAEGAPTILLLDSTDYPFVDEYALAGAFRRAARHTDLLRVDEVFILHGHGAACRVLPVKLGERLYPHLPEFEEFNNRRAQLVLA